MQLGAGCGLWRDFCTAWGSQLRDIESLPDDEDQENVHHNVKSGEGLSTSRAAQSRPPKTPQSARTEERATWRYMGPNPHAHPYISQIQSWCQGRPKARPIYGTRVVLHYQTTSRSSSWRSPCRRQSYQKICEDPRSSEKCGLSLNQENDANRRCGP